jgi:RNase P/RNase MRP subunit p30
MAQDIVLFKNTGSLYFQLVSKKEDVKNFDSDGILIDADEKECRRTIEFIKSKSKQIKIAVLGRDDEFNRRALETLKINYLVSPEITEQRDNLKQRASGINHVTAKIAKDKNVVIVEGINFIFLQSDKKSKARLISRIIQNIKVCRKAKCEIKFATFAKSEGESLDERQIAAIGFSFGMSSQQTKTCFNY